MDYREIERLAAVAEKGGGYAHITGAEGDYFEIPEKEGGRGQVGPGRDCITFLQILLRRSQAREAELKGIEGYDGSAVAQARQDARNEVLAAVNGALSRIAYQ